MFLLFIIELQRLMGEIDALSEAEVYDGDALDAKVREVETLRDNFRNEFATQMGLDFGVFEEAIDLSYEYTG